MDKDDIFYQIMQLKKSERVILFLLSAGMMAIFYFTLVLLCILSQAIGG